MATTPPARPPAGTHKEALLLDGAPGSRTRQAVAGADVDADADVGVVDATPLSAADATAAEPTTALLATTATAVDAGTIATGAQQIGELAAAGLGGYWPTGLVQQTVEAISATLHLPWWAAIVVMTTLIRFSLLPLNLRALRNNVTLGNLAPQIETISARVRSSNAAGDKLGAFQATHELASLFQQHNAHPLRSLMMPLVQMPIFISVFFALRSMAKLPVESMKHGGILWFTDLTLPDPYYVLPIVTSLTMLGIIEVRRCRASCPCAISDTSRRARRDS